MAGKNARLRLEWSARARRDLLSIDEFYSRFGAPIANRVTGAIVEAAAILELNPLIGVKGRRQGTRHRIIAEYPYCIVYRVKPKVVQIVRVLHQSRKYFN
jgi:plasmid stabilization system protein ParE